MQSIRRSNIFKFTPILTGLLNSIILAVTFSIILGITFFFAPVRETMLPALSAVIIVISVFWGGRTAAKRVGSRGLILGATVGLAFFILTTIITVSDGTALTFFATAKQFGLCLVAGALGGIFGVSE